ncbi:DUF2254 domain-containing protein [Rhodococcus sp. G-MC3]|uniref:DUF2254 domain-containing protein n=1 Tax=Rhodococcus sp. G-MC3 TaxID=3046209 RepID=UPI0024BA960D|nr:DUF2254 domain-containing protein [Rhodococcus sp. G-MC3]MDJ0396515.1 DUF2254 domain-containing protein [Rhodococcus sp. G-MC3]
MTSFKTRVLRARDSFWFLPAMLGVAALIVAQALVMLDRYLDSTALGSWGFLLYRVGASGSRDILGAIGGSMLAVAATSFSITISVLATASSTYGPRLVRNFMSDRGNQFVLGIFGATFLYSLMVLRSIRSDTDAMTFVPDIAVNVAVLLAVVDVAVLVYFIHHIADSIQVSTLSARVRGELVAVTDALYPKKLPDEATGARTLPATALAVGSDASGFVVRVDENALIAAASKAGSVVEMHVRAGSHVIEGENIASFTGNTSDAMAKEIRDAVVLDATRTPSQDIEFAIQQLTEMAVRAMSPSTNDPYTARNALAELAVGMVPLATRPAPLLGRNDADGHYRLTISLPSVPELIDQVFDAIRQYGLGNPPAVIAAVDLARRIGTATIHDEIRVAVVRQLTALRSAFGGGDADPIDVDTCCKHIDVATSAINAKA